MRSRILRHNASALRFGQFSNFCEKLRKNLYSRIVIDMRRCILMGCALVAVGGGGDGGGDPGACETLMVQPKDIANPRKSFCLFFSCFYFRNLDFIAFCFHYIVSGQPLKNN